MSRSRARLEKLEAFSAPSSRVVVVHGHCDAEHKAKEDALIASGDATERDLFVSIMWFSNSPQQHGAHHEAV